MHRLSELRATRAAAVKRAADRKSAAQEFTGVFPISLRVHLGKPEQEGGIRVVGGHHLQGDLPAAAQQGEFPLEGNDEQMTATLVIEDEGTEYRVPLTFTPAPETQRLHVTVGQNEPGNFEITGQDYEHHKDLAEAVYSKILNYLKTCVSVPPVVVL